MTIIATLMRHQLLAQEIVTAVLQEWAVEATPILLPVMPTPPAASGVKENLLLTPALVRDMFAETIRLATIAETEYVKEMKIHIPVKLIAER